MGERLRFSRVPYFWAKLRKISQALSSRRSGNGLINQFGARYGASMTDQMPDRLSVNPNSPYYDQQLLLRGVGIRFNGEIKTNIEEYCISEGWVKVAAGKAVDRKGNPLTLKLKGIVEAWMEDETDGE